MLDTTTESFKTALSLQTRLSPADLEDPKTGALIEGVSRLGLDELKARFA